MAAFPRVSPDAGVWLEHISIHHDVTVLGMMLMKTGQKSEIISE